MDTALTFRHYLNQRCFSLFTTNAPNELTEKNLAALPNQRFRSFVTKRRVMLITSSTKSAKRLGDLKLNGRWKVKQDWLASGEQHVLTGSMATSMISTYMLRKP